MCHGVPLCATVCHCVPRYATVCHNVPRERVKFSTEFRGNLAHRYRDINPWCSMEDNCKIQIYDPVGQFLPYGTISPSWYTVGDPVVHISRGNCHGTIKNCHPLLLMANQRFAHGTKQRVKMHGVRFVVYAIFCVETPSSEN